jgi:low affinity Fe/Cu permease
MRSQGPVSRLFSKLAQSASQGAGSAWAFAIAITIIIGWALIGPAAGWSDTWQLVINTGTTIVTFLMVFLIQHAQNKDMKSIQIKLDELIGSIEGASNKLIDVEDLDDDEVDELYQRYRQLAASADEKPAGAHLSVDEAQALVGRARDAAAAAEKLAAHARRHDGKRARPRATKEPAQRRGRRRP